MQSIWSESWKSSEFITTKIAFTSRSVAALQENDLANRYPPMPSLTTTLGGTIAAVCFRCQSQRNYEFAIDTRLAAYAGIPARSGLGESAAIRGSGAEQPHL
jgi:hypothetical protein